MERSLSFPCFPRINKSIYSSSINKQTKNCQAIFILDFKDKDICLVDGIGGGVQGAMVVWVCTGEISQEVTIELGFEGCVEFHGEEREKGYCWRRQSLSIK